MEKTASPETEVLLDDDIELVLSVLPRLSEALTRGAPDFVRALPLKNRFATKNPNTNKTTRTSPAFAMDFMARA
jgi:hypothetical protein